MILATMTYMAKMAELAINRQSRQTVNKNSNELAMGPFFFKIANCDRQRLAIFWQFSHFRHYMLFWRFLPKLKFSPKLPVTKGPGRLSPLSPALG